MTQRIFRTIALIVFAIFSLNICYAQEYGWIDIATNGSSEGAGIFIDGVFASTAPAKIVVPSGKHTIAVHKELHTSFVGWYTIEDAKCLCLSVELQQVANIYNITAEDHVELWIDGHYVCKGSWEGKLPYGEHTIEGRLADYKPTIHHIKPNANTYVVSVNIDTPKPKLCSAKISSTADSATVFIDGQERGTTPLYLEDCLAEGEHIAEVVIDGQRYVHTLQCTYGETTELMAIPTPKSHPDRFTNIQSLVGKSIRLYNASTLFDQHGAYAYTLKKGKPSPIKEQDSYRRLESINIQISEIVTIKKRDYIRTSLDGNDLYLRIEDDIPYLDNIRSASYWAECQMKLVESYSYLDYSSNLVSHEMQNLHNYTQISRYLPILWHTITLPDDINEDVVATFSIVGYTDKTFTLPYSVVTFYAQDFTSSQDFKTRKSQYEAEVTKRTKLETYADDTPAIPANYIPLMETQRVFEATFKLVGEGKKALERISKYNEALEGHIFKDLIYTLSVYGYVDRKSGYGSSAKVTRYYKGVLFGDEVEMPSDALTFTRSEDKVYIDSCPPDDNNRKLAATIGSVKHYRNHIIPYASYTQRVIDMSNTLENFYRKNSILLISQEYAYSNYQFGLKFNFYNPFAKDIKYIEMDVVAYNGVGDKQRDDIGRHTKNVRCIGPINKQERATYVFDELFWDGNDIIDQLRIDKLTITFMDNTTKSYPTHNHVKNLRLSSHTLPTLDPTTELKGVTTADDLKQIIDKITPKMSSADVINTLGDKLQRIPKTDISEDSSSGLNVVASYSYAFHNTTICGIANVEGGIIDMHIEEFNLNGYKALLLKVLNGYSNIATCDKIDAALSKTFGACTESEVDHSKGIHTKTWRYKDYNIVANAIRYNESDKSNKYIHDYYLLIIPSKLPTDSDLSE